MSQRESIVKAKVPPHSPLNEDTMQYETPTWNFKREFKKQKKKNTTTKLSLQDEVGIRITLERSTRSQNLTSNIHQVCF